MSRKRGEGDHPPSGADEEDARAASSSWWSTQLRSERRITVHTWNGEPVLEAMASLYWKQPGSTTIPCHGPRVLDRAMKRVSHN